MSTIDLSECDASDILQIGNILETKEQGSIAMTNESSVLTSGGTDRENNLNLYHSWHILDNYTKDKNHHFDIEFPGEKDRKVSLKQIDLEFTFKKKID